VNSEIKKNHSFYFGGRKIPRIMSGEIRKKLEYKNDDVLPVLQKQNFYTQKISDVNSLAAIR